MIKGEKSLRSVDHRAGPYSAGGQACPHLFRWRFHPQFQPRTAGGAVRPHPLGLFFTVTCNIYQPCWDSCFVCSFSYREHGALLCRSCTKGKRSRREASFKDSMTHIVLSIKKPSGRRAILLQDRADVTPGIH